ncbi:MAG TPA: cytochrome b/b6 domain-containing protein [Roseiarcus sp.]|nr:cytochrome b/b6 domain-containing protein [Roseiarcus sp.]
MDDAAMSYRSAGGYSFTSRFFHWLTAALVLATFLLSVGGPEARVFAVGNKGLLTLHESLGFAVLMTTVLRLAHRVWAPAPEPVPTPFWMHQAALAVRVLLYFLLVFLPLSAIVGSWIEGHSINFYFVGEVASPWGASQALGGSILRLHKLAGDAIMWLAGVHAAAALFHHFILKDNVLRSMLVSS